jgi:hypothetical protein
MLQQTVKFNEDSCRICKQIFRVVDNIVLSDTIDTSTGEAARGYVHTLCKSNSMMKSLVKVLDSARVAKQLQ